MQRKARGVLLALVAVLAMSAVTAAAASATTPEFKPVPAKKKFTSSTGAVDSTWLGGEHLSCAKSTSTGTITGATTIGDVVEVFTGCTNTSASGEKCSVKSTAGKAGEVITYALKGELGTISTGFKVGLMLEPETGKKYITFAENGKCMPASNLSGTIAGVVEPIGSKQLTHKLTFGSTGGNENIREITLDSGILERPELTMWGGDVTMETTDTLTFEEAVEIT
jgi:hypothetical protein